MLKIAENFTNFFKRRYDRHYREKKFHLAVDIMLSAIVLILLIMLISIRLNDFSYKNKLSVKVITSSEKIVSGRLVEFDIKYANVSKFNLLKAKLSFNLPENFIIEEVSPVKFFDKMTHSFEIGDLIPGANGTVKIKGIIIGEAGSAKKLITSGSYFQDNEFFSELFIKNFKIDSSGLELKWNNSGVLYRGQPAAMSLNLKNTGLIDLIDIEFNFINQNISLSSDDNILIEDNRLRIKQLKSGDGLSINFNLIYNGNGGSAGVRFIGQAVLNGQAVKQADSAEVFSIKEPDLSVKINSTQTIAGIDESISYSISLKNSGTGDIGGLTLNLLSGDPSHTLELIKIKPLAFVRLKGSQIIFDKNFRPGEEMKIGLSAKFSRLSIPKSDEISLKIAARYIIAGSEPAAYYFSSPIKIKTTYKFKAETRYFSVYGDQLGVGPIPPVAGIPTKYWIFWQFTNQGNELSNFLVSADLPPGVIWSDESSVNKGNLAFDRQTNSFAWQVDSVDSADENCRLVLALTIIPDAGNARKSIFLLKNINYSFSDNFTGEVLTGSAGSLTNDLSKDSYAANIVE